MNKILCFFGFHKLEDLTMKEYREWLEKSILIVPSYYSVFRCKKCNKKFMEFNA